MLADSGVDDTFYFHYNANGEMIGYTLKTVSSQAECFLVEYQQGDVEKVISSTGAVLAAYTYDAWGNILSATGPLANSNSIRYRGYYFDTETGFYYVSRRYYDSEICRFINTDDVSNLCSNGDFASLNLIAYCGNNPVTRSDPDGTNCRTAFAIGITATAIGLVVLATLLFSGPFLVGAGVAVTNVATAVNAIRHHYTIERRGQ